MNGIQEIRLDVFNKIILIHSYDEVCTGLITSIYQNLICSSQNDADINYEVSYDSSCKQFNLSRNGVNFQIAETPSDFIYYLEKDFTIETQKLKPDFFYLHAAAISKREKIILISGDSGAGKSTTVWALLHHDYKYLSDELAPVNLDNYSILPFPHALCLKNKPPNAYPLPENTIMLDRTTHIPIEHHLDLHHPNKVLNHIFFIQYDQSINRTLVNELSEAESTLQLYKNGLNQLAHPNDGLLTANQIIRRTPCHSIKFSDIKNAINIINDIID
jgi:hypothetical protein